MEDRVRLIGAEKGSPVQVRRGPATVMGSRSAGVIGHVA
ncbi:protein of unknown function [Kyrpidia spormannii]|uniref:Uncharacterized protein n=1 Tax=Kyrpidia spormannii TaxID=2055160 RepID=A0ACA8Z655_9BACL|nr:protein of unknown function [Kyrpidia spormannii]